MKKGIIFLIVLVGLSACQPKPQEDPQPTPPVPDTTKTDTLPKTQSTRTELYRPQIHYTVHHNWSNDPNGLCYQNGIWHLYYQYNPNGIDCDFGGMSWGHAESRDLMHWEEKATVLYPDGRGSVFSGCSVVDVNNVAGFGKGAILAYYTAASEKQLICLAISTDNGQSFNKYAGNPIVPSTGLNNFRDPKVVYDPIRNRWTMIIARGWDLCLEIWHSTNLLVWSFDGIFRVDIPRCNIGQWECCDLLYFPNEKKWVMIVSLNPGGYITGSSISYYVGSFDGTTFTPDSDVYPRWLDYGADCYAGVTWDNAPDHRKVMIAWMNNWDYSPACPPQTWKNAYTLPMDLTLRKIGQHYVLCHTPSPELDQLAEEWHNVSAQELTKGYMIRGKYIDAFQSQVTLSRATNATITLYNIYGERYVVTWNAEQQRIYCDRSGHTGQFHFSPLFSIPSISAPIESQGPDITIDLIVDHSSVELFAEQGEVTITNTVYPQGPYMFIQVTGDVIKAQTRTLETIWKK